MRPLAAHLCTALLGLACAALLPVVPADAAEPAAAASGAQRYTLPAGPLNRTLYDFAAQAGITLTFDAALTDGLRSSGLDGSYSPETGLNRLLAGSGLEAVHGENGGYRLRRLPAASWGEARLAAVMVTAAAERTTATEGTGSYTQTGPSTIATGLGLSVRETPQSVSVVTQQQMLDQNMQSLDDVALTAAGITFEKVGTERSNYQARGFAVTDMQLDGMAVSVAENFSLDVLSLNNLAIYDRVEILRGSNGLMQGTGNPSGSFNLLRKRPTREFQLKGELGAGSWADYRAQIDVSGPLNAAGTLRGRAVAFANNANSYKTGSGKDNRLLYGIIEADLAPATTLTLGAIAQKDDHKGYEWGGLVTREDGSFYDLPRSTSLAGPWAHLNRHNTTVFGDLAHHFDNGWKITAAANAVRAKADYVASYPSRVSGDLYNLVAVDADYKDKQWAVDLKASGPFTLFGREHELMLGASHRRDDFRYPVYSATSSPTVDITNFDYYAIPEPTFNYAAPSNYHHERKETGLSFATRLRATDALSVILGTRLSRSEYTDIGPWSNGHYKPGSQIIPYAGLVYDLSSQHTLYASYTDIYRIQGYYGPGGLLDPVQGKNYEAGLKSDIFDGRLSTALAIFQTDQVNLPERLDIGRVCGVAGTSTCYIEGGKVRNRGIEIEASGSPLPGWNLSTSFTYSDPEYIEGSNRGQDYNTIVPRRLFKVATDYRLPGDQWRVGGDIQARSGAYKIGSNYHISQGGYALLNLHANYQHNRSLSVQLNVHNALDKHYYVNVPSDNNFGYAFTGTPRSFAVTLRYEY
nr:TonB-dependent siderophore receptor [Thauera linaloolentis]